MFPSRLPAAKPKYIGLVHGLTRILDDAGMDTGVRYDGYWILTECAGKRTARAIGDPGTSPFALHRLAAVEAWLAGGPAPPLGYSDNPSGPKPKPRKPLPAPKAEGNVVHLPRRSA
jgi:hypothetical protein